MKPLECYRLLGLPNGASCEAVKFAYRKRARLLHPDINRHDQAAHEKFIQLTAAYKILLQVAPSTPKPVSKSSKKASSDQRLKHEVYQQLRSLLKNKQIPRAIMLIEALGRRLPRDVEVKQWQGIVYHLWGRHLIQAHSLEQAEAYLIKAQRIDPGNRSLFADVEQDLKQIERFRHTRLSSKLIAHND